MRGRTPSEKDGSIRSFHRSKKAVFGRLWQAAIGLGIFILVTSLVALMTEEVRDIAIDNPTSNTATNESITYANLTLKAFGHTRVSSVVRVGNATIVIGAGNYTYNSTHINMTVLGVDGLTIEIGAFDTTYTFNAPSAAENITGQGLEALVLLGDWQTIIVIAVVMVVLIGLILRELGYLGGEVR